MTIPFYANSEKLAADNSIWVWVVHVLYFALCIGSVIALDYFDRANSIIIKLLIAITVIGMPCLIMAFARRNILRHGDEFLQLLYLKQTAYNGVGFLFVIIVWELWGRLTNEPLWDNMAISLAPYLMLTSIFFGVRREIRLK